MIKIKRVWIEWQIDYNPDLSWLDTDADYHYGTDGCNWNHVSETDKAATIEKFGSIMAACEHYADEDQIRLQAYYDGEWHMLGCVAMAIVLVPWGNQGCHRIQKLSSTGLWGIESDSDDEYRKDIEKEQLEDLKEYLERFGVDTSDFFAIYEEGGG